MATLTAGTGANHTRGKFKPMAPLVAAFQRHGRWLAPALGVGAVRRAGGSPPARALPATWELWFALGAVISRPHRPAVVRTGMKGRGRCSAPHEKSSTTEILAHARDFSCTALNRYYYAAPQPPVLSPKREGMPMGS